MTSSSSKEPETPPYSILSYLMIKRIELHQIPKPSLPPFGYVILSCWFKRMILTLSTFTYDITIFSFFSFEGLPKYSKVFCWLFRIEGVWWCHSQPKQSVNICLNGRVEGSNFLLAFSKEIGDFYVLLLSCNFG